MYIGRVDELKKLFNEQIAHNEDDQLYVQKQYLKGECDIVCDVEGYIFTTHEPQISRKTDSCSILSLIVTVVPITEMEERMQRSYWMAYIRGSLETLLSHILRQRNMIYFQMICYS